MPPSRSKGGLGSSQANPGVLKNAGLVGGGSGRGRGGSWSHACLSLGRMHLPVLAMLGLLAICTMWLAVQVQTPGGWLDVSTTWRPGVPGGERDLDSRRRIGGPELDGVLSTEHDPMDPVGPESDGVLSTEHDPMDRVVSGRARESAGSPGYPRGEDDIHVVFSTDCSGYQSWQAVVLFHSAILSGHNSPITQLVSGCSPEEEEEMKGRHERNRHIPEHKLFFTPSFSVTNPQTGEDYPYMNKPNAMSMWMNQTQIEESVIALIDPDFIFLKPLTPWIDPKETVVRGDGLSLEGLNLEGGEWIRKGHPAGQRFGLPNWTHWDRDKFCPPESPCMDAPTSTAKRYFDLIPPYIAHKDDWAEILPEWVVQAPKVFNYSPSLLSEQTAYATAAATVNLKHYRINSYAIESEKVEYESWDTIDNGIENVCDVGIEEGDGTSHSVRSFPRMPNFIHYCHMYRVGYWLFNKRRYRKDTGYDQLECGTPLLEMPPMDVQRNAFKMHPGARYESITVRSARRNAFVLCIATRFVNSALRRYQDNVCDGDAAVAEETIRIT